MSYDEVHEMFPDTWSSGHAACRCCPLSIPRATSKSHAAARYFVYVKKFLKKFFYGTALFWTATGNTESRRFQSDPGQQFSGWTMEYTVLVQMSPYHSFRRAGFQFHNSYSTCTVQKIPVVDLQIHVALDVQSC